MSVLRHPGLRRVGGGRRRGRRALTTSIVALAALTAGASALADGLSFDPFGTAKVASTNNAGAVLLPSNQWVSPLGTRILDNQERLVSSTLSPDGTYVAALGWNEFSGYLTIVNVKTQKIVSRTSLATGSVNTDYSVAADGPLFSSDGKTLWVPQASYLAKFSFDPASGQATFASDIPLCGSPISSTQCNPNAGPTDASGAWLPSGMALSSDGSKLYVALNGANKLGVIDTASDTLTGTIPVGNAPRQVVISPDGTTAYVSNEGGRPAAAGDFTNLSDGTPIVSDHSTGAATTGTVSVVNLASGKETQEIPVGLQPTALYQHGTTLFVANSNGDSMSLINEASNQVAQTVNTNPVPGQSVGSYANAISMVGDNVLVSIGRDNAIAVYSYHGVSHPMRLEGLLPTDWYPVQVQSDPALGASQVVVTNDKGIGAQGPPSTIDKGPDTSPGPEKVTGHNSYDDTGSVTLFQLPSTGGVHQATRKVFANNDWPAITPIDQGRYDGVPSVIPAHLGDSSPIKHVVVIVRENRTYDQVLGDLGKGNGDPSLAQFGQTVTPNIHAVANRFGTLDNFYDEGTLSADGHNWIVQSNANDYVEKEFGAFYRSYPSQGGDALAYQRNGFLWNAAQKAGQSVRNFGEYMYNPYSLPAGSPEWGQWYRESQWLENGHQGTEPITNPCQYTRTQSDIPSLQAITAPCFPNFQLSIPDQYRVDQWLPTFRQQEQSGSMPNLTFMWLMTDHTGGANTPYPVAQVADNDLAVGRVVDAISHSKFWKSTAIFVVEDDTQNGVDHVDGHRGPAFVISPYSKPGVHDQYYTQLNMVRTVEQILGIPPMNQEDASVEPMYGAFTAHPDYTPFTVKPNQIPLTLGAPGYASTLTAPPANATTAERKAFRPEGVVPANMLGIRNAWDQWVKAEAARGLSGVDRENPAQLNRFDWYSAHDWTVAYPGDRRIYLPDQVPGRHLPADYIGGN